MFWTMSRLSHSARSWVDDLDAERGRILGGGHRDRPALEQHLAASSGWMRHKAMTKVRRCQTSSSATS
jgi:hypothetical protein